MPFTSSIDPARKLAITTASGRVSLADFLAYREVLTADPEFDSSFALILDLRKVTELNLTADEIRQLATQSAFSSNTRRAFVVGESVVFGLSRMYSTYRDLGGNSGETRVFKTLEETLEWLGIPA